MTRRLDAEALLDVLHAGVVVHDSSSTIVYANPRALELLKLTLDQALGRTAYDPTWHFLDENEQRLAVEAYPVKRVLETGNSIFDQIVGIATDEATPVTWASASAYPERDAAGAITQVVVTFIDITAQRRSIPFAEIVGAANDAVIVTTAADLDNGGPTIVYVNDAFTQITGYTAAEAMGQTPKFLQGPDTSPEARAAIAKALREHRPVRVDILNYTKAGHAYWLDINIVPLRNALGEVTYYAAVERDVTEQRTQLIEMEKLSSSDPLTGLLNRRGFERAANRALATARRDQSAVALAMLDLDHFKSVNDEHGHAGGDRVLQIFSQIMLDCFRGEDIPARVGGEEFAVLLPRATREEAFTAVERFRCLVADSPMILEDGGELAITVSIGLTVAGAPGEPITDLMKRADAGLYRAKREGRNRTAVVDGDLSNKA